MGTRCRWRGRAWGSKPAAPSGPALVDEALAASKAFVPSLQVPRLRGPAEWAGWVGAGFLKRSSDRSTDRHVGQSGRSSRICCKLVLYARKAVRPSSVRRIMV